MVRLENDGRFKSCPFCGGEVQAVQYSGHKYAFECTGCGAEIRLKAISDEEAIAKWNRRAD